MVEDTGLVARFLTNPVAVLLAVVVVAMLVGARSALGHVVRPRALAGARPRGATGGRCTSRPGTSSASAPRSRRRRTCCRWRCWPPSSAASPAAAVSAVLVLAVPFALWGAWRFLRVAGRLATPAGREPLADPVGRDDVRAGAGRRRRLGRGPARPGARPPRCCRGWRTPRSASPTRRRTGAGARPGAPGCCSRWSPRRHPLAWLVAALVGRRRGRCWRSRCCPASVGTGRPGGRRWSRWPSSRCCSRRGGCRRCCTAPARGCCSTAGCCRRRPPTASTWRWAGSTTSARRGGSALVLPALAAARAGAAADPDPGAHLLGGRAARGRVAAVGARRGHPRPGRGVDAAGAGLPARRGPGRAGHRGGAGRARPRAAARALRRAVAALLAAGRGRRAARRAGLVRASTAATELDRRPGQPASRRTWCRAPSSGPEHGILVVRGSRGGRADLHRAPRRRRHHRRGRGARPDRRGPRLHRAGAGAGLAADPGRRRRRWPRAASSTSCCRRPPTARSPPRWTPPAGWCRPAPRTAAPGPGRSTGRSRPSDLDGPRSWLRIGLLVAPGAGDPRRARALRADAPTAAGKAVGDEAPARGRRGPRGRAAGGVRAGAAAAAPGPRRSRRGEPPVEHRADLRVGGLPGALPGTGADLLGVSTLGADPDDEGRGRRPGRARRRRPRRCRVRTGRVSTAPPGTGPAVVTGADDLAPGLVAGPLADRAAGRGRLRAAGGRPVVHRRRRRRHAQLGRRAGQPERRPGASPTSRSARRPASSTYPRCAASRCRATAASSSTSARSCPRRGELSLEVHTSRGRLAVHVVDSYDELGAGRPVQDWLPAQAEPATTQPAARPGPGRGRADAGAGQPGRRRGARRRSRWSPRPRCSRRPASSRSGSRRTRTEAVSLDDVLAAGGQGRRDRAAGRVDRPGHRHAAAGRRRRPVAARARARGRRRPTAVVVPAGPKRLLLARPRRRRRRHGDGVRRARQAAATSSGSSWPRTPAPTSRCRTRRRW